MAIDLHLHSTASDGTLSPKDLVDRTHELQLACIALTDHDTMAGTLEAQARAQALGIRFIPGVELTAHDGKRELHLLGYFVDSGSEALARREKSQKERVVRRLSAMIERLKTLGIAISLDEVLKQASGAMPTRLHLARALIARGHARDARTVFGRWIGDAGEAYVSLQCESPAEIYALIAEAGGIGGVAHPGVAGATGPLTEQDLERHCEWGAKTLEVIHPCHTKRQVDFYRRIADRLGLAATGGSDFHDPGAFAMGAIRGAAAQRIEAGLRKIRDSY